MQIITNVIKSGLINFTFSKWQFKLSQIIELIYTKYPRGKG